MRRIAAIGFGLLLAASALAQSDASSQIQQASRQGLGPFLGLCFVGGLLALLTPCVFPMLPVTISYFTKRETNVVAGALAYCVGIVSTFAVLGVGAAVVFGASGINHFATNAWVNLVLAAIFVALALNLFGFYELKIKLPGKLATASRASGAGVAAPFFMGMAFSVTSFTCTAPIAGGLLTLSGSGKSLFYPVMGMLAFGVAFSLPFLLLAFSPSLLKKLPKSGNWLGAVKPALGFIELAAAVKFLSNADLTWQLGLLKRTEFLAIWAVIALGLGLYLLGVPKGIAKTGWPRRGLAVLSLCLAAFLTLGLRGTSVGAVDAFLPPSPYPSDVPPKPKTPEDVVFLSKYDEAVAKAKATHQNIFVDFTGVNCVNCRWMEDNIFVLNPVKALLGQMVTVQLYTDRPTDSDRANQKLQEKIGGTIALPVYVIVTPEGKVIKTYEGKAPSTEEFLEFLHTGVGSPVVLN
jgi:thiol:disulfide interchange protein DsbD